MNTRTVDAQYLPSGPYPLDGKAFVGTGFTYETIENLLENAPSSILYEGMLVVDTNYSVTWQIYYDGSAWQKRIYDGMFHVKTIYAGNIFNEAGVNTTLNGVSINEGDIVFQVGGLPQLRGLYTLTSDSVYRRHPLFKYVNDQLTNVIIVADDGTTWKNSQWVFTNTGTPTVTTDYNDGDPTNPMLWDDFMAVTPASYWQTMIAALGQPHVEAIALQVSPYYYDFCSSDLELASDIWGKGVSDTWLNFEMTNGQSYDTYKNVGFDTFIRNVVIDASATDVAIDFPFHSYLGRTTSLVPSVEYYAQRIDSVSDYYAYLDTGSFVGNETLPECIFKESGDYAKFMMYQNPTNVTDLTLVLNTNRKVRNYSAGTYVTDTAISDFVVPQGYNIFAIKGTVSGGSSANIGIGTTSDASDILDPTTNVFTSSGDIAYTWNVFTTNLSDTTQLYVKQDPSWSTDTATDVTLEICCYQDNF
jgi:hypothetical protein